MYLLFLLCFIAKQKVRVRFSGPNEPQDTIIPQVSSTGSLKRTPSFSRALSDQARTSISSIRSSGSDNAISISKSSLSSNKVSPSRTTIFHASADVFQSGSPDSDVSSIDVNVKSLNSSTQETFLMNERKFIRHEVQCVRDKLSKKVGRCLSYCWRDILWHRLLITETCCEEESVKKSKKKNVVSVHDSNAAFKKYVSEWRAEIMPNSLIEMPDMLVCYFLFILLSIFIFLFYFTVPLCVPLSRVVLCFGCGHTL